MLAAAPRKAKGQENWKPMSKTSITALEEIVDLSILSVLATRRTDKDEVQKHLNIFQKKFLGSCTELPVPAQKHGDVVHHVSRQLREEIRKSTESRKTLAKLEEDLGTVVSTLEQMEEETDSLDHECSRLKQQLEQEEEKAQEVLQLTQHEVLNLPPVPPRKDNKPTIQERLLGLVPETDRGATARRLGTALQNVSIQNALTLMKHVHKHADHLLTPPDPQTNSSG